MESAFLADIFERVVDNSQSTLPARITATSSWLATARFSLYVPTELLRGARDADVIAHRHACLNIDATATNARGAHSTCVNAQRLAHHSSTVSRALWSQCNKTRQTLAGAAHARIGQGRCGDGPDARVDAVA